MEQGSVRRRGALKLPEPSLQSAKRAMPQAVEKYGLELLDSELSIDVHSSGATPLPGKRTRRRSPRPVFHGAT